MIPKSDKLRREQQQQVPVSVVESRLAAPVLEQTGPIKIKTIACLNEHVALLLFMVPSARTIEVPDDQKYENKGMVIGFGPGLPNAAGGRCPSQLKHGDMVTFQHKHIITAVTAAEGFYKGQRVAIINERSLLHKLPPIPYEVVDQ